MIDVGQKKEKIISFIKDNGPSLPVRIAKTIEMEPVFASAILSELLNEKRIKMSNLRVGSSSLYLLQGQEKMLEDFADNLKSVEKEAFLKLKEKIVLEDEKEEPAIRVALRNIKDFAIPFEKEEKLFWRYSFTDENKLSSLLNPKQQEVQKKEEKEKHKLTKKEEKIGKIFSKENSNKEDKPEFLNEVKKFLEKREIDLIEEIARIYGYDKVPETLTKISIWGKGGQKSTGKAAEETIREFLVGTGLNEVISHALISKGSIVNKIMNIGEDKLPKVQNPLSSESEALRPSALCGIMDVLSHNINRKIPDMRIFELGRSYFCKDDGTPSEKGVLAIALCGIKTRDWRSKTALDIFDLKGIVEALFEKLGISGYEFEAKASPLLAPSASSSIKIDGKDIGILGKLNKAVLDGYDIKVPIFVSEMDLKPMCAHAKLEQKFVELPRYPSMIRDISLIVEDKISNGEITGLIKRTCGDLAVSVKPFDLYRGEQVPKGSKSILYSVEYRASGRTLTDEEVNVLDKKIRGVLAERFNAKIR